MAERADAGEIVKRALAYPYASPATSFMLEGAEFTELRGEERAVDGGTIQTTVSLPGTARPLLAYGANASPRALARKLVGASQQSLFASRAWLRDFDVVYSAHVSPYGAVPATLHPSPGTNVAVHVIYPSDEQLPALVATEPNYELARLRDIDLELELGPHRALTEIDAFLSRHGPLTVDGAPLALSAIKRARGRLLPSISEPEVLELVRSRLAPELSLERFVVDAVESGGIAPLPEPFREVAPGSA